MRLLLDVAIAAVDPERLTGDTLADEKDPDVTVIAIGKASTAMCRGAARRLGETHGICVTTAPDLVPDGIELMVGDHPIPGEASLLAGRRVLEAARRAEGRIVALISGGGSALCEHPIAGVSPRFLREANQILVSSGAPIADINLVRRHLSAIKGGGLAGVARRPIETYAISDVCGGDPSVIASGPTIPTPTDPDAAIAVMVHHGINVPPSVQQAMRDAGDVPGKAGPVRVIADGHTAADGIADHAHSMGWPATVLDGWLQGPVDAALEDFMTRSGPALTIAAGEPDVAVSGDGRGGRNTHAALLAAKHLAGTHHLFAAFATDGIDGNSGTAGAIVDGTTIERGGDPEETLERYDSANYLRETGDLVKTGPTGTNVSDLWVLWK